MDQLDADRSIGVYLSSPISDIRPRKLRFTSTEKDDRENIIGINSVDGGISAAIPEHYGLNNQRELTNDQGDLLQRMTSASTLSPPYRKIRALRLFDTPATPKTILQKSSTRYLKQLDPINCDKYWIHQDKFNQSSLTKTIERPRYLPLHYRAFDDIMQQQTANVNPFSPDSVMAHTKKRSRTKFGYNSNNNNSMQTFLSLNDDIAITKDTNELLVEMHQAPKRLALQDTNISRYRKEFVELAVIGVGQFGKVYQCLNRLDGCIYAIKKSIKPVAGSSFEKRALNEVWAHAVLGKHDNVVRYYSAWAEDNHMLIQNEYCNGGSLQSQLQERCLVEAELKILLLHVSEGLRYIHSNDLVHMDLKPGNIFFTKEPSMNRFSMPPLTKECYETGMDGVYEELSNSDCLITYKIGDLGHVTSVKEPNVEEGDCHYLPRELLDDDFGDLFKVDIFSLGLTLYEAAGGGPLPKNGPKWHQLRDGNIPHLSTLSAEFNDLIQAMTHPDRDKRPSSTTIFNHTVLNSLECKSKIELSQELTIEKRKNELLLRKLREAKKIIKNFEQHSKDFNMDRKKMSEQRYIRSHTRRKSQLINEYNKHRNSLRVHKKGIQVLTICQSKNKAF